MTFVTRPNSWVAFDASSDTTLTYALQVDPAPLTVSTSDDNSVYGSLQFVITNDTGSTVDISEVEFRFEAGPDSDDLTPTTASIHTDLSDPTNWTVTGPPAPVTSGTATYTLGPASGPGPLADGASLVVQLYHLKTGFLPGTSTVTVREKTEQGGNAQTHFQVTTFPTGFFFNGLAASVASGSSLTPVAQVDTGSKVTLTWNSSVVDINSFEIHYSDSTKGQQTKKPTDTGTWITPAALTSDTVFTVVVTTSAEGGQSLTAALSTAVSVRNPSLVAADVTVNGSVHVKATAEAKTLPTQQGTWIGWNRSGDGLTYFANQIGKGFIPGGFEWILYNKDSSLRSIPMTIGSNGNVAMQENLSVKGEISGIGMVPPGGIVMQTGSTVGRYDKTGLGIAGTSYEGWAICNSQNGTPDLRGRFVLGCNDATPAGTKGGEENVTLTIEQMPSHTHNYTYTNPAGKTTNSLYSGDYWAPTYSETPTTATGGDQPHTNMPPYYALYFIMRLHS